MLDFALRIATRLLACSAVSYWAWKHNGAVGLVVCAPLFGVAFARPIVDLAGDALRFIRQRAYRRINGRHYAHRGVAIDIVEDEKHDRWLLAEHVRKLIPGLPNDEVLRRRHPECAQAPQAHAGLRLKAETLARDLEQATRPESLKFRHWLAREVIFPARRLQQRAGLVPDTPTSDNDTGRHSEPCGASSSRSAPPADPASP